MKAPLPACTIASNNYLALAQVFAESYRQHHPGAEVFVCVADEPDPSLDYDRFPFRAIFAAELGIPAFRSLAFRYDILELNTAVKPFLLAALRDRFGLARVAYFDPDILIHDRLDAVAATLEEHVLALTPHVTQPLDNELRPTERKILLSGVYNLGFLALRLDHSTEAFLEWWADRLHRFCLDDPASGLFLDQIWMGFAPAFLDRVAILRDPTLNVAYWNLTQRRPLPVGDHWEIDGRRVGFFHFSGLPLADLPALSRHQNRIRRHERPELLPLLATYRRLLLAAGFEEHRTRPYAWADFRPVGGKIPALARRELQRIDPLGNRWPDPFAASAPDSFFAWLTEPIATRGGTLNRLALACWEERAELVREFPFVCGSDLGRFAQWLRAGGAAASGLSPEHLTAVVPAAAPGELPWRWFDPRWQPQEHGVWDWAQRVGDPSLLVWLNDPVPGTRRRRPVLTRAALQLHGSRPELQLEFPDPLGADQRRFARWFCSRGAADLGLPREMVEPVWRSLSLLERRAVRLPAPLGAPSRAVATAGHNEVTAPGPRLHESPDQEPVEKAAAGKAVETRSLDPAPTAARGWNVFSLGQAPWPDIVSEGARLALAAASIPCVGDVLERDSLGRRAHGRLQLPSGVPYPLTLLVTPPEATRLALSYLPVAATATGAVVGWWLWPLAHLPATLAESFSYLTELWAPSRFCLEACAPLADIPLRLMPPCLPPPAPELRSREEWGLEAGRFYFHARCGVGADFYRQNPDGAVAAFRSLVRQVERPVGLVLRMEGYPEDSEHMVRLRAASRELPVLIVTEHLSRPQALGLMAACDAGLTLDRSTAVGLTAAALLALDKPVVATGYGGITEFLDEGSGFPVPGKPVRIEFDLGALPRGALWVEPDPEAAAAAMALVITAPEEAASRTREGRRRVEERFGVEASGRRLLEATDRLSGLPRPRS